MLANDNAKNLIDMEYNMTKNPVNLLVVRQCNMSILALKYEQCTRLKVQSRHCFCDSLFAALLSITTRLQQYHSMG